MLSKDFSEFFALLNAHGAKYPVVGGYAMAVHGRPRQTGDLDIRLKRDHDNAPRVMVALRDFGFGDLDLSVDDFEAPDQVIQLGYPPPRIDLLTGIDSVDFDDAWPSRFAFTPGELRSSALMP